MHTILLVDDEQDILDSLELTFEPEYNVFATRSGDAALEVMAREEIALMIVDQRMPGMTGTELLGRVTDRWPDTIRMLLTGYADMGAIVRAVNEGRIYRYITKPWDPPELLMSVQRALEHYDAQRELAHRCEELAVLNEKLREAQQALEQENVYLRREVEGTYRFESIVGDSAPMRALYGVLERVIASSVTVLLAGETGTGKELVARCIHYNGPRKDQRFVVQNCGALPEELLESELFGHRKGSFTGAFEDKEGLFEVADGGTIFLDEIGDTSPAMQVRLLRVLQEGEIRRVGETEDRTVDVRVVAATNRDLAKDVEEGRFREDLYYRLSVFPLRMPPLRERRDDIPPLAAHFLEEYNRKAGRSVRGFGPDTMDALTRYDWPGNVRELQNEIERAIVLCEDGELISLPVLSERIRGTGAPATSAPRGEGTLKEVIGQVEREMISEMLRACGGNRTQAAKKLGLSRWGLVQKIQRQGIEG